MEIIWSIGAIRSLNATLKYWIKHNKSDAYSKKLYKMVSDELSNLSEKIESKVLVPFFEPDKILIDKKYSIFYKVNWENNELLIVRFWDNRRNPANLKLKIKEL